LNVTLSVLGGRPDIIRIYGDVFDLYALSMKRLSYLPGMVYGHPKTAFLVHGEEKSIHAFARKLKNIEFEMPQLQQEYSL